MMTTQSSDDLSVIVEDNNEEMDESRRLFESNYTRQSSNIQSRQLNERVTRVKRREVERVTKAKEEKKGMENVDAFLSSSLSNELIYIMLHGICQFTLLNFIKKELTREQNERFQRLVFSVDEAGDIAIKVRPFVIADPHAWDTIAD